MLDGLPGRIPRSEIDRDSSVAWLKDQVSEISDPTFAYDDLTRELSVQGIEYANEVLGYSWFGSSGSWRDTIYGLDSMMVTEYGDEAAQVGEAIRAGTLELVSSGVDFGAVWLLLSVALLSELQKPSKLALRSKAKTDALAIRSKSKTLQNALSQVLEGLDTFDEATYLRFYADRFLAKPGLGELLRHQPSIREHLAEKYEEGFLDEAANEDSFSVRDAMKLLHVLIGYEADLRGKVLKGDTKRKTHGTPSRHSPDAQSTPTDEAHVAFYGVSRALKEQGDVRAHLKATEALFAVWGIPVDRERHKQWRKTHSIRRGEVEIGI